MYEDIREQLLARRAAILRHKSEKVAELIDDVPDRTGDTIDVSTDEQIEATQLKLEGRFATELIAIDTALARIDDGSYGECEECGEEIPAARLRIHPLARTCVDCQETAETDARRRYKRPGLLDEFSD